MNILVQCCACVILLVIWYFLLRGKRLGLETAKLFLVTMGVCSFCVVMDILSIAAICSRGEIPELLLAAVCKTYIASLIWSIFFCLMYTNSDLYGDRAERFKNNLSYIVLVLAGTLLIYLLPIHYYQEGRVVYTYGPACIVTYAFALLYAFVILYKVAWKGKGMNSRRRQAVITWMLVWVAAAVIQFLNAELLLVSFSLVLGMLLLFFEMENPERNIDLETGFYNVYALGEYIKQLYGNKEAFSAIMLAWRGAPAADRDNTPGIWEKIQRMKNPDDVTIFKMLEEEMILFVPNEQRMNEVVRDIRGCIDWNLQEMQDGEWEAETAYALLPDSTLVHDREEFFQLWHYARTVMWDSLSDNLVILDGEMISRFEMNGKTIQMIRSAMEEDRVEVFYQPIYSTSQNRFVSAEALVRIRNTDGSIVPPGKFIPVAEESGLISQIGEIVFDQVCRFIKENRVREKYGIRYVEVNLSVRQCENPHLADDYIKIMEKHGVDASYINLEITESASLRTRKRFLKNIHTLLEYGVKFSLDDYGTGESNLNYIVDMPVSIVKFDMDMTRAYFTTEKARFVMEASVRMIHDLGLAVVSEGVETEEQLEKISALGIEYIQGYYFSKPLPGKEFLQFVTENQRFGSIP